MLFKNKKRERRKFMLREKQAMQRLFCYYYAHSGNIEESALKAGFPQELALAEGIRALSQRRYKDLVDELCSKSDSSQLVLTGLKRLAFGSINDAIELAFSEDELPRGKLAKMDFFNISEIKKVKGGGVEIKVFDRLKALEAMIEYHISTGKRAQAFEIIDALKSVCENDSVEEE